MFTRSTNHCLDETGAEVEKVFQLWLSLEGTKLKLTGQREVGAGPA